MAKSKKKKATAKEFKELAEAIREFLSNESEETFKHQGKLRKDNKYMVGYIKSLSQLIKRFNLFEYSETTGFSIRDYWVPTPKKIKSITLKAYNVIKKIYELEDIFNFFVPTTMKITKLINLTMAKRKTKIGKEEETERILQGLEIGQDEETERILQGLEIGQEKKTEIRQNEETERILQGIEKRLQKKELEQPTTQQQLNEVLAVEAKLNAELGADELLTEFKESDLGNIPVVPDIETRIDQDIIDNHAQQMAPTVEDVINKVEDTALSSGDDLSDELDRALMEGLSSGSESSEGLPQLDTPAIAVREQAAIIDNTVNTSSAMPEVAPASVNPSNAVESLKVQKRKIEQKARGILQTLQKRKIQQEAATAKFGVIKKALDKAGEENKRLEQELKEARAPMTEEVLLKILSTVTGKIEMIETQRVISPEDQQRLSRLRNAEQVTMSQLAEIETRRRAGLSESPPPEEPAPSESPPPEEPLTPLSASSFEGEEIEYTLEEQMALAMMSDSPSPGGSGSDVADELGGRTRFVSDSSSGSGSGSDSSSGSESRAGIIERGTRRIRRRIAMKENLIEGDEEVKLSHEVEDIFKLPGNLTTSQILSIAFQKKQELEEKPIDQRRIEFMSICEQYVELLGDDDLYTYDGEVHALIIGLMYTDIVNGSPEEYIRQIADILPRKTLSLIFSTAQGLLDEELIKLFEDLNMLPRLQEDSLVNERVAFITEEEADGLLRRGVKHINEQLEINQQTTPNKINNVLLERIKTILRVVSFDTLSVIRASLSANPLLLLNPVSFSFDIMGDLLNTLIRRLLFYGIDVIKDQQIQTVKGRLAGIDDNTTPINKSVVNTIIEYIDTLIERPEPVPEAPPRSNVVPIVLGEQKYLEGPAITQEQPAEIEQPVKLRFKNSQLRAFKRNYTRQLGVLYRANTRATLRLVGERSRQAWNNYIERIIYTEGLSSYNFEANKKDIAELLILNGVERGSILNSILSAIRTKLQIYNLEGLDTWPKIKGQELSQRLGAEVPERPRMGFQRLRPRQQRVQEPSEEKKAIDEEKVQTYYELLNNKLASTIATIAGVGLGAVKSADQVITKAISEVPLPSGISAMDVRDVIVDAAIETRDVLAGMPSVGALGGIESLGVAGLATLIYGGLKLGQYFTETEVQEIEDGLKKGTTEFYKGEERPVPVEDIDKPYGDPLLRPEFMMTGTDYFDKQFSRAPLGVNNSEWSQFNYVPKYDKYNGIEMSNMFNDSIRYREPLYLPKYKPPPKPPSMQAIIATMPVMYDQIQLYQPFMDKFDGAYNPLTSLNPVINDSIYSNAWYDNKLYNPDRGVF